MIHNNNVFVSDEGGGTTPTPVNEQVTFPESVELDTTLYLNELLYDTTNYFASSMQDFVDGLIQVKSVEVNVTEGTIWDKPIIKESTSDQGIFDFEKYVKSVNGQSTETLATYVENCSTTLYDNLKNFAAYAYEVEFLTALIEQELKKGLTEEEYQEFINLVKDDVKFNNITAFTDDATVGKYIDVAKTRILANFGTAMLPTWDIVKAAAKSGGISEVLLGLNHLELLGEGIKRFMAGSTAAAQAAAETAAETAAQNAAETAAETAAEAVTNGTPAFASKILMGVGMATAFFAIGLLSDWRHGELTWENTAVRAAKTGLTIAAGYAGTAIADALVAGTAAGSWGGAIGSAIGAALAVVGNLAVDKIVHDIHYTSNDMPKNYTPVTANDVREMLIEEGYCANAPVLSEDSGKSMYDEYIVLCSNGASSTLINFLEQKVYGYSAQVMEAGDYQHYLTIFTRFVNGVKHEMYDLKDPNACTDFIDEYKGVMWDFRESDNEFIGNLFEVFSKDNADVQDFLTRLTEGEILERTTFDDTYFPEYEY